MNQANDFETRLAAREAALGLTTIKPTARVTASDDPVDAAAGDAVAGGEPQRDPWGNRILGAPGPMGQYRIESARDHRVLRVCGEAHTTKHLLWWDYDAGERRMICTLCWGRTSKPAPAQSSQQAGQAEQAEQAEQEARDV